MNDYFDQQLSSPEPAVEDDSLDAPSPEKPAVSESNSEPDTTPPTIKAAVQELLKYGLVEQQAKPNIYRSLQSNPAAIAKIIEPLDFQLQVDDVRGLIFLKLADHLTADADEAWQHPLLRRLRLTLEQSLLIAILRQHFIAYEQECGIGAAGAYIDFEDLLTQFDLYLGETGSEQRNQNRLANVLDQLNKHGIVAPPDKENRIQIRPIIVHLANPEQLQVLLAHLQQMAQTHPAEMAEPKAKADDASHTKQSDAQR